MLGGQYRHTPGENRLRGGPIGGRWYVIQITEAGEEGVIAALLSYY